MRQTDPSGWLHRNSGEDRRRLRNVNVPEKKKPSEPVRVACSIEETSLFSPVQDRRRGGNHDLRQAVSAREAET